MKTYSLPRDDCSGNFPVWSEYDLLRLSSVTIDMNTSLVRALAGSWAGDISSEVWIGIAVSMGFGFVERMPCCCIRRWPLLVWRDLGRCLVINFSDSPGKALRWPALAARRSVDGTGLNRDP